MQQITLKISLVVFHIENEELLVFAPEGKLPSVSGINSALLDEQIEKIFTKHFDTRLDENYFEQLYTFSAENEITVGYYVLLAKDSSRPSKISHWIDVSGKTSPDHKIIAYALQRLRWKVEYTNAVYSLLPQTFTLSDLQKTYEIILGKKLDKRNFRKKILSLKFLKPTRKKRIDKARPARLFTFTRHSLIFVKVFS